MKLIVLSNPTHLKNEHEWLCSLFEMGLEYYHLRKPGFEKSAIENFLKQISPNYYNRIVLHSHYELAEKYNLKGIHISSPERGNLLSKCVSTSFHSLKEIEDCEQKYEYAFLSPIFDSISKQGYQAAFGKKELNLFFDSRTKNIDIIALGGINEQTIPEAMSYGFDGVAVLGAVWMSTNPVEKFNKLLSVCNIFTKINKTHHA